MASFRCPRFSDPVEVARILGDKGSSRSRGGLEQEFVIEAREQGIGRSCCNVQALGHQSLGDARGVMGVEQKLQRAKSSCCCLHAFSAASAASRFSMISLSISVVNSA